MKFGKRSDSDDAAAPGASAGDSFAAPPAEPLPPVPEEPPPVVESSPLPPVAEQEAPGAPAGEELPVTHVEPVVEGEAYEVFADEAPETLAVEQHEPAPMPFPVAEQPVSVVTPEAAHAPAPVTSLGDSGEAFASGHAAAPGPSWQEPVMAVADERPELVVAAAFAGGLLAAMILRRLGN